MLATRSDVLRSVQTDEEPSCLLLVWSNQSMDPSTRSLLSCLNGKKKPITESVGLLQLAIRTVYQRISRRCEHKRVGYQENIWLHTSCSQSILYRVGNQEVVTLGVNYHAFASLIGVTHCRSSHRNPVSSVIHTHHWLSQHVFTFLLQHVRVCVEILSTRKKWRWMIERRGRYFYYGDFRYYALKGKKVAREW